MDDIGKPQSTQKRVEVDARSTLLLLFHLVSDTNLPTPSSGYNVVSISKPGSPAGEVQHQALEITFDSNTPRDHPILALTFGSDQQQCNVTLTIGDVRPVHCVLWAQLNSGRNVFVLTDLSTTGTSYSEHDAPVQKTIVGRSVAAINLQTLKIGPYVFSLKHPKDNPQSLQLDDWFARTERIPVSKEVVTTQLGGRNPELFHLGCAGEGVNGKISKVIELRTGQLLATKVFPFKQVWHKQLALKEIGFIRSLCHQYLAEHLFEIPEMTHKGPVLQLVMPLYHGSLAEALPLPDLEITEKAMAQITEGLHFMHEKEILHRDVKPENVVVHSLSPIHLKLCDFGWAAPLQDTLALRKICGTPGYAAPEIPEALGVVSDIIQTAAVDVFALGGTYYYMLHPERRANHQQSPLSQIIAASLPLAYANLIKNMIARNPENRPSIKRCLEAVTAQRRTEIARIEPSVAPIATPLVTIGTTGAPHMVNQQRPNIKTVATLAQPIAARKPKARRPQPPMTFNRLWGQPQWQPKAAAYPSNADQLLRTAALKRKPRQQLRVVTQAEPSTPPPKYENIFGHLRQPADQRHGQAAENTPIGGPVQPAAPQTGAMLRRQSRNHRQTSARNGNVPAPERQEGRHSVARPSQTQRQIRRHPARARMVYRLEAINQRKEQLRRGVSKMYKGVKALAGGVVDTIRGAYGLPCEIYGLIFNDVKGANEALQHIAPKAGWVGAERRLMYGVKSHSLRPCPTNDYTSERYQSYLKATKTGDSGAVLTPQEQYDEELHRKTLHINFLQGSQAQQVRDLHAKLPEPQRAKLRFREPAHQD